MILVLGALAVMFATYFLPSFIASNRHLHNAGQLYLMNIIVGWTVLGWFCLLLWALDGATDEQVEARRQLAEMDRWMDRS